VLVADVFELALHRGAIWIGRVVGTHGCATTIHTIGFGRSVDLMLEDGQSCMIVNTTL
jgi:hypothetical protein